MLPVRQTPGDQSGRLPGPPARHGGGDQSRAGPRSDRLEALNSSRKPAAGRWCRSAPGPWSAGHRQFGDLRSIQSGQDCAGGSICAETYGGHLLRCADDLAHAAPRLSDAARHRQSGRSRALIWAMVYIWCDHLDHKMRTAGRTRTSRSSNAARTVLGSSCAEMYGGHLLRCADSLAHAAPTLRRGQTSAIRAK